MKYIQFLSIVVIILCCSPQKSGLYNYRYKKQADRITIIRDTWGIPHIYGKTDADVVFGLMYAQCEESFERVERAYIEKLGRISEIEGEKRLYDDLSARMLYDTIKAIKDYQSAPGWLQTLCVAFADGVNYYIQQHPGKVLLLKQFKPWYPLLFTDGAYIALQTDGLRIRDTREMYNLPVNDSLPKVPPTGSNAFAIAPAKTVSKHAMLYINPHVSFHYRMEAHMVSEEGLNTYGVVTWGQFFIYQGFNNRCGWMHTSSMADAADIFLLKPIQKENGLEYVADDQLMKPIQKQHVIQYKKGNNMLSQNVVGYYTVKGPVIGKRNGEWMSMKAVTHSLNGLLQSWQRMKTTNLEEFKKNLDIRANGSTNTMYADDAGNIAYWHGNFIPKRDTPYNRSKPLYGTNKSTDWKGIHTLDEIVHVVNPSQGFLQNCNSTPFSVSGLQSLQNNHPVYMAPDGENFRSLLAIKELESENAFTLEKLIAFGHNTYLAAFDTLLPPLIQAYDALLPGDSLQIILKEPISILRAWDKFASTSSVATTLAVDWGYKVIPASYLADENEEKDDTRLFSQTIRLMPPRSRLDSLLRVVRNIEKKFGSWRQPWGVVNRYQRITGKIKQTFSDDAPSDPVPFTSSIFGCLPAYEVRWPETKKGYGYAGNSFLAAVEFGPRIKAKAINQGGQSFDPNSKHFNDQTQLYIKGKLRDVYFYPDEVEKNKVKSYQPGK